MACFDISEEKRFDFFLKLISQEGQDNLHWQETLEALSASARVRI